MSDIPDNGPTFTCYVRNMAPISDAVRRLDDQFIELRRAVSRALGANDPPVELSRAIGQLDTTIGFLQMVDCPACNTALVICSCSQPVRSDG